MSVDSTINNKKIAKNTVYLYLRMLISLVVTLFTSRVIVNTLGIDDFGIYNIIGGVIVLFSFVSHSLRTASQRFLSYELGKKTNNIGKVFNTAFQTQILMAISVILLAETIGLYFFHTHLNIPEERVHAAEYVFQFSIITFILNLFQTPYQALIISYERMSFYALISIFDIFMKLLVVYLLLLADWDKLIIYSILMAMVSAIHLFILAVYSYNFLGLSRFTFNIDWALFKKIFGYAGWSMVSACASLGSHQGGNVLLNIYNGVAANAAFGIANQVNNAIFGFVSNFQAAFNPQIVKSYASGMHKEMYNLINRTSLFSYYLLLVIAVPFIVNADVVLKLWLGTCPEYAAGFCILMLLYFLIDALEAPLWMLIGATGKMKVYTIWSASLHILSVPIAWIMLNCGYSIYWVFVVRVIINFISAVIRPVYVKMLEPDFSIVGYIKYSIIRAMFITTIIIVTYYLFYNVIENANPLIVILISLLYTLGLISIIGINRNDKVAIVRIVKNKIKSS